RVEARVHADVLLREARVVAHHVDLRDRRKPHLLAAQGGRDAHGALGGGLRVPVADGPLILLEERGRRPLGLAELWQAAVVVAHWIASWRRARTSGVCISVAHQRLACPSSGSCLVISR